MEYIQIEAFKYEELADEVKDKITPELLEDVVNMDLKDEKIAFESYLEQIGFIEPTLNYSLNYCQGDGASFTFQGVDVEKLENTLIMCQGTDFRHYQHIKRVLGLVHCDLVLINPSANSFRNRYCHTYTIDLEGFIDNHILDQSNGSFIEDLVNTFIDYFLKPLYLSLCREFEKIGYSIVDLGCDYDYAQDFCKANNFLFLKDGTLLPRNKYHDL